MPVSSSFKRSPNTLTEHVNPCIHSYINGNSAAKENGCESSSIKDQHQQQQHHHLHAIDRALIDFSNNNNNTNNSSMSAATAMRAPFQARVVSEESYCAPWDLKSQEEKLKQLSEQRQPSSSNTTITALADALLHPSNGNNHHSTSNNNNQFHRTRSARTSSSMKKSLVPINEPVPPVLPPLPPGGLVPSSSSSCQCGSSTSRNRIVNLPGENLDPSLKKIAFCLNAHAVRSGTDTSRSFVFSSSSSPSNERSPRVNTAPAKVDLSLVIENRPEPLISQTSTPSTLSTTSSIGESSPITPANPDTKPISFEAALLRFKRLNSSTRTNPSSSISASSLPKSNHQEPQIAYERPWDTLQTSLIGSLSSSSSINHRNGGSLQKMPSVEESPPFPVTSTSLCRHGTCSPEDKDTGEIAKTSSRGLVPSSPDAPDVTIPIDRYFWYHYAMSRRTAETILQTRSPGSFLVRQSESGNQHDYSLSIRTNKSCMHMRICYSTGFYILGECSRPFSSVARMIEFFSHTSVPIRGAAPVKLGTPVFRCETSPKHDEELL